MDENKRRLLMTASTSSTNSCSPYLLTCAICLDQANLPVATRYCGHVFCDDCMRQWMRTCQVSLHASCVCPTCRQRIPVAVSSASNNNDDIPFVNEQPGLITISLSECCNTAASDAGNEVLECVQCCKKEIREPVVLASCGHSYCWRCLFELIQACISTAARNVMEELVEEGTAEISTATSLSTRQTTSCKVCCKDFAAEEDVTPVYNSTDVLAEAELEECSRSSTGNDISSTAAVIHHQVDDELQETQAASEVLIIRDEQIVELEEEKYSRQYNSMAARPRPPEAPPVQFAEEEESGASSINYDADDDDDVSSCDGPFPLLVTSWDASGRMRFRYTFSWEDSATSDDEE